MKFWTKVGISGIFCLGALTCVASVMRFVYTFYADLRDPECMSSPSAAYPAPFNWNWHTPHTPLTTHDSIFANLTLYAVSGARGSWWLVTELHLGLLCPCLITLQPIFLYAYVHTLRRLSPKARARVSRFTGVEGDDVSDTKVHESGSNDRLEKSSSVNSKPSDIEAQKSALYDEHAPPLPVHSATAGGGAGGAAKEY